MSTLRILGCANSKAATIVVDRASPRSQVSAAFLFNNDLNSLFDSTGCDFAHLAILVPSEGGYYSSSSLSLQSSTTCVADVVLGADWLAPCRIKIGSSTLQIQKVARRLAQAQIAKGPNRRHDIKFYSLGRDRMHEVNDVDPAARNEGS